MNIVDSFADVSRFVALRRDIHAHPELGFEEHRTSKIVADLLREWGLEVHTGIAGTGVVGVLRCGSGGRSIGLRADLDALPLQEAAYLNRTGSITLAPSRFDTDEFGHFDQWRLASEVYMPDYWLYLLSLIHI